jgi:transcription termination factor Rho
MARIEPAPETPLSRGLRCTGCGTLIVPPPVRFAGGRNPENRGSAEHRPNPVSDRPATIPVGPVQIGRIYVPVTETKEQVSSAASADGSAGAARASRARAKSPSLASMLLPELQQLASGMGISTAKVKKSDLVAAIQAARANGGSSARTAAAPSTDAASTSTAASGTSTARQRNARQRRPENGTDSAPAAATVTEPTAPPASEPAAEQRPDGARGQRGQRQNNQNNQNNQSSQGGAQNNQGGQAGQNNQGGGQNNQAGQGGQNNQNRSDEDDFDGGRRRGRRYRDRRGRNRERPAGGGAGMGGANVDVEPTISDDDILTPVAGILDAVEEKNTWFVRTGGYYAGSDDVYVANSYVRRYGLRRGDAVTGAIRQSRDGERREKYNPLVRLDTVNGRDPEEAKNRVEFTKLTPLYPQERLRLETEPHLLTTRVIDLVMPIGKGQRALIVSPPKAGKTMVLQAIANAIATNNPEVHLMVVLVDERPEEVTDMQRSVKGEVIASTFDRRPSDHTMVAELSIERAKRLVELGHDVVVLLDSITRLGRSYNLAAPASGRILSGGVDSTALYQPKRFLGAARNIENGGSLTIIATALVETGSAGDTVFFEEYKGTGNAELKLDRKIADKRVFPAIDVDQSGTRKEEILLPPDELAVTIKLRRVLHALETQQAIDLLLDRLRKTRTNIEFLMQIAKTTPGQE